MGTNLESSQTWGFRYKPLLLGGEGGKVLVELTVNSNKDFCPNYVQEFGLRAHVTGGGNSVLFGRKYSRVFSGV
jgi:hypothetical protein